MIGTKRLEVDEETLVQIVNDYLTRQMPALGVAVGVSHVESRHSAKPGFRIELAERQEPPPLILSHLLPNPTPPSPGGSVSVGEPNVRVMRMEGVK